MKLLRISLYFAFFSFFFQSGLLAQSLPNLPALSLENFGPEIREQIRKAYAEAQSNPQNAETTGKLGMVLQAYEQNDFALICYTRARRLAPKEFRWIYYSATVQTGLGNQPEAAASFKESLKLQPDYIPALLKLADSLHAVGQFKEAELYYQTVINKDSKNAHAQYGLGRTKVAKGDIVAGIEHFRKAIELFQEYGAAHYALGLALRDSGQGAEAQEHLALSQKYKHSRPLLDDPLMRAIAELNLAATERLKLAVALGSSGNFEQSIVEHERALEIDPNLIQAHINLISLYGRAGRSDKAEQHYRDALAINPDLADIHYNYGVLLVSQEKYNEAARAFERAAQLNPFHAEAHHNYAVMIEREGRLDEAAAAYRKAIENNPGHRPAHFHLGRILVHEGKLTDAIEQFLLTLKPEDEDTPRFTYALGATYIRMGEKQKGIEYLRAALKQATALGQTQLASSIERDLKTLGETVEKPEK